MILIEKRGVLQRSEMNLMANMVLDYYEKEMKG